MTDPVSWGCAGAAAIYGQGCRLRQAATNFGVVGANRSRMPATLIGGCFSRADCAASASANSSGFSYPSGEGRGAINLCVVLRAFATNV